MTLRMLALGAAGEHRAVQRQTSRRHLRSSGRQPLLKGIHTGRGQGARRRIASAVK